MPDHDLLDRGPRLRRFFLATCAGLIAGLAVALICWNIIDPAANTKTGDWRQGPWRAMSFFTAIGAFVGYGAAHRHLMRKDKRREFPTATAIEREIGDT